MIHMRTTRPDTTPSRKTTGRRRSRRTRCAILAAAGVSIVAVTVASCSVEEGGSEADPVDSAFGLDQSQLSEAARSDPAEVIEDYRIAYNSGDIERVMALFSDESVLTRHPFAARSTGLSAIRSVQLRDLSAAAPADAYHMSNVEVSGDTVTWDHEFTNSDGDRWCAEGNTAIIATGKIKNWVFAPNPRQC